jgi:hypothetical protein
MEDFGDFRELDVIGNGGLSLKKSLKAFAECCYGRLLFLQKKLAYAACNKHKYL